MWELAHNDKAATPARVSALAIVNSTPGRRIQPQTDHVDQFIPGMPAEMHSLIARWSGDNTDDQSFNSATLQDVSKLLVEADVATLEYFATDSNVVVRAGVAAGAAKLTSGSYTVHTPP